MADDELKRRIAAMRRQGLSDQEIARRLQAERNAAAGAEGPDRPRVPSMASGIRRPAAESTSSAGAGDLARGPEATRSDLGAVIRGIPRAAAQGLLFGGYDELEGGVRSLFPGRTYAGEVEKVRGEMGRFREDHPVLSYGSEIAGSLVPIGTAAKVVRGGAEAARGGLTLARTALRGAGVGAGAGAVAGALSADPAADDPNPLATRLGGGVTGGVFGGAFGGAVPLVARAASRPISTIIRRVEDLGDDAGRLLRDRTGAVGRGVGRAVDAEELAALEARGPTAVPTRREAEALARRFFGRYGRNEKFALDAAMRRVERDGIDLATALQEVDEVAAGRPFVVADVGGRSTKRLGAAAEAIPGEGTSRVADFFDERIENRADRLAGDVLSGTKARRVNLQTRGDEIAAARRELTEGLYDAAGEGQPRIKLTDKARKALETPEGERALERADRANREAQAARGRRPLEPVTEVVEVTEEVPLGRADRIEKQVSKADGRVTYVGGNPKFATASTERLEALYREQMERLERSARMQAEGARPWTRFDPNVQEQRSGFAVTNEYGRGKQLGNVAERQARELEQELVGRYQAMKPEEFNSRVTRAFGDEDGAEPIWHEWRRPGSDDAPDWVTEGVTEGPDAPPQTRTVVTGARKRVKDAADLATLDAYKKQMDRAIGEMEEKIVKGEGDPDLLASLVANRDEVVRLMEQQSPVYETAKGYAQDTALRQEGVKVGKELGSLRATPDEIRAAVGEVTPEGTLRVPGGVEDEIRNAAATRWAQDIAGGQGVERIVGGSRSARAARPELSRRVEALFGDDAAQELGRRFDLERRMAESERAITGSRTVPLGLDVAEIAEGGAPSGSQMLEAVLRPGQAAAKGLFNKTIRPVWNRGIVGLNRGRAEAIGRLVTGGQYGPEDLRMALQLLASRREREANALARSLRIGGLGGTTVGRLSGR